jgi:hypothetical protein
MGWAERANPRAFRKLSLQEQAEALAEKERKAKLQQGRTEMISKLRRQMFVRRIREKAMEQESPSQDHQPTTQGGAQG